MIERPQNHWKLGLFLATVGLLAVVTVAWFGMRGLGRSTIAAVTYFDESVEGLSVGSPLSFRGVPMGRVTDITFAPNNRDVEVRLVIYSDVIRRLGLRRDLLFPSEEEAGEAANVRIQIDRSGLTGVTNLAADFFDPGLYPERELDFEAPRNTIPSQASTLKNISDSFSETMARMPELTDQLSTLFGRVNARLDEIDVEALVTRSKAALERAEQALATLSGDEIPELVRELTGAAEALREGLAPDGLIGDARASLTQLDDTLEDLERLVELLERDPGALLHGRSLR